MNAVQYGVAITSEGALVFEGIIREDATVEVRYATLPPICCAQVLAAVVHACLCAYARDTNYADDELITFAHVLLQDLSSEDQVFHEVNSFRTKDGSDA